MGTLNAIAGRALAVCAAACIALGAGAASGGTLQYYYDSLGRVIGVYPAAGVSDAYTYDAAGNRANANAEAITAPTMPGTLLYGQSLTVNARLYSPDSSHYLVLQSDGNLVLYHGSTSHWGSSTVGQQSAVLTMQGDGNLVLYGPQYMPPALWASNTSGNSGAYALVQNDGNFVVYTAGNTAIWASNTAGT